MADSSEVLNKKPLFGLVQSNEFDEKFFYESSGFCRPEQL